MSTIAACGGFAAVCGSSIATAATMARVAMPSMRRYSYADSLSAGSIAAGGTLGILIPPSVPMVIYGILAEADIGKLFIAGILPGILLAALFIAAIAVTDSDQPCPLVPPASADALARANACGVPHLGRGLSVRRHHRRYLSRRFHTDRSRGHRRRRRIPFRLAARQSRMARHLRRAGRNRNHHGHDLRRHVRRPGLFQFRDRRRA